MTMMMMMTTTMTMMMMMMMTTTTTTMMMMMMMIIFPGAHPSAFCNMNYVDAIAVFGSDTVAFFGKSEGLVCFFCAFNLFLCDSTVIGLLSMRWYICHMLFSFAGSTEFNNLKCLYLLYLSSILRCVKFYYLGCTFKLLLFNGKYNGTFSRWYSVWSSKWIFLKTLNTDLNFQLSNNNISLFVLIVH